MEICFVAPWQRYNPDTWGRARGRSIPDGLHGFDCRDANFSAGCWEIGLRTIVLLVYGIKARDWCAAVAIGSIVQTPICSGSRDSVPLSVRLTGSYFGLSSR